MKILDGLFIIYFILGLVTVDSDLVYVPLILLGTTVCYFGIRLKKITDEIEREERIKGYEKYGKYKHSR